RHAESVWCPAGPWLSELAVIEWMKQSSPASSARCGSMSEIILPDWPRGRNSQSGLVRAPFAPWKVINLSPPGRGWPCCFSSSGLKSHTSRWLSAPEQKMTRIFFALGAKCGGLGALGRSGDQAGRMGDLSEARRPCSASKAVRAIPPRPVPPKRRKSRRLSNQRPAFVGDDWFVHFMQEFAFLECVPTKRAKQVRGTCKTPKFQIPNSQTNPKRAGVG